MPASSKVSRLLFATAAALSLAACSGEPDQGAAADAPAIPVRVAHVAPAPFLTEIAAVGRVEPDKTFVMAFKNGGVVRSISVEAGDRVTKGQTLAELDPRDVEAQYRQALETAEKAARDLERVRQLHAKGFASDAALQDATAQARATRASAEAAKASKSYAQIVAPGDGIVLKRHVEANGVVAAGAPVLTVSQASDAFVLTVGLADRDAVRVAVGDTAEAQFDAWPGKTFRAAVSEVGADADPRTGAFTVKLRIEEDGALLRSGLVGHARIRPAAQGEPLLAAPVDAILEGHGEDAIVFVVDPASGVAKRQRIKVGRVANGMVAVTGGLTAGVSVVVDGAGYLTDGERVTIATARAD